LQFTGWVSIELCQKPDGPGSRDLQRLECRSMKRTPPPRQDEPRPAEISLSRDRRCLTLRYGDGREHALSAEFLRVHSPSAEVRGHGGGGTLPLNKQDVLINDIEPVGNYAVRLVFDDGHNSGLYTWAWLDEIGRDRERLSAEYLAQCAALRGD
jgi:DUF971 family protein